MNGQLRVRKGVILLVSMAAVTLMAIWVRQSNLGATSALQDSVGPYLAAIRLDGRAHAPPYGILMLPPYWVATLAGSLWSAMGFIAVLHALAAPVAAACTRMIDPSRSVPAVVIGALVAFDPGLLDTVQSGAEGYLGPLFMGLLVLCRGPLAWLSFAAAVANHPLSLCAAPLLLCRKGNFQRDAAWGAIVAIAFIGHQSLGWGSPGVAVSEAAIETALSAYLAQGGGVAILVLMGPIFGLLHHRTRRLSFCCLGAAGSLLIMGLMGGYLRDHHLRLLTIPFLTCWAGFASWLHALGLVTLFLPPQSTELPHVAERPDTLSLASIAGQKAAAIEVPVHIERVWFDGSPAIEPSALMLDLALRGEQGTSLQPEGRILLIVAGTEGTMREVGAPGVALLQGPNFALVLSTALDVDAWLEPHCDRGPKTGAAWDGYTALKPEFDGASVEAPWQCP